MENKIKEQKIEEEQEAKEILKEYFKTIKDNQKNDALLFEDSSVGLRFEISSTELRGAELIVHAKKGFLFLREQQSKKSKRKSYLD